MKTKKTIERYADTDDVFVKFVVKGYAEKHKVNESDILIGMNHLEMVVQSYNEGESPKWNTLEIISFDNN